MWGLVSHLLGPRLGIKNPLEGAKFYRKGVSVPRPLRPQIRDTLYVLNRLKVDDRRATKLPQVIRLKLRPRSGVLEKRSRDGWRKRQVTLVVSHKARH